MRVADLVGVAVRPAQSDGRDAAAATAGAAFEGALDARVFATASSRSGVGVEGRGERAPEASARGPSSEALVEEVRELLLPAAAFREATASEVSDSSQPSARPEDPAPRRASPTYTRAPAAWSRSLDALAEGTRRLEGAPAEGGASKPSEAPPPEALVARVEGQAARAGPASVARAASVARLADPGLSAERGLSQPWESALRTASPAERGEAPPPAFAGATARVERSSFAPATHSASPAERGEAPPPAFAEATSGVERSSFAPGARSPVPAGRSASQTRATHGAGELAVSPALALGAASVSGQAPAVEQGAGVSGGTPVEALPLHVEWLAARGGGSARVRLHPPHLGEVELRVTLRDSVVEVVIRAQEPMARALVASQRELLAEALASRELRMEQFEVIQVQRDSRGNSGDSLFGDARGGGFDREGEPPRNQASRHTSVVAAPVFSDFSRTSQESVFHQRVGTGAVDLRI